MDKKTFDETAKRLNAVNKVVSGLDPAIREDGWAILKSYVTTGDSKAPAKSDGASGTDDQRVAGSAGPLNVVALREEHASDDDAAENALLVAGILFAKHGHGPYAPKEFTDFGESHHLLMPRMGNFLPRTKRDGKKIFRNTNDGWVITTHGGKWLAATFKVKRGTEPKPE